MAFKKIVFSLLFCGVLLLPATEITPEIREKIANEGKIRQQLLNRFHEVFAQRLKEGKKDAVHLAERIRKNAGNVMIDFSYMKKLLLKWDQKSGEIFKMLPTSREKALLVQEKFEKLFDEKVKAEDQLALQLAEKGHKLGKLSLSVKEMRDLIAKWEKKTP